MSLAYTGIKESVSLKPKPSALVFASGQLARFPSAPGPASPQLKTVNAFDKPQRLLSGEPA